MNLTVTVPAFNESAYLPATLDAHRNRRGRTCAHASGAEVDIVVVDNNSTDDTAAVARSKGAVGGARAGAGHRAGTQRRSASRARRRAGLRRRGHARAPYTPRSHPRHDERPCLRGRWRRRRVPAPAPLHAALPPRLASARAVHGRWCRGATQFCRRDVLEQVGGYDEQAWIGEDVDFYRALQRCARASGGTVRFHRAAPRAGVLSPVRQVAAVEDAALDEPALHRPVPPPQGVLGRLVPAFGAVGCRAGVTLPRNTPWRGHV